MNVRNFWADVQVDGRGSKIGTGPAGKDGGFSEVVKIRDNGEVKTAALIEGRAFGDELEVTFTPGNGVEITRNADGGFTVRTKR